MNDVLIPVTMCHELSHLSGYMREDEANFIAFLACLQSDDPEFRYSGVYLASVHAMNALLTVDSDLVEPGGRFKKRRTAPRYSVK